MDTQNMLPLGSLFDVSYNKSRENQLNKGLL